MEMGIAEMVFIGLILVVFFGPKKLPELGAGIGKAIRDFKRTLNDTTSEVKEHLSVSEDPPAADAEKEQPKLPAASSESRH